VPVTRVSEGSESCTFKQYFHNWDSVKPATTGSVKSIAAQIEAGLFSGDSDDESEAFAKFVGKSASARGYMPDEGAGELKVFRASEEPEDITESVAESPKLYQSDVYVVKYQYKDENDEEATVVYLWIYVIVTRCSYSRQLLAPVTRSSYLHQLLAPVTCTSNSLQLLA
ncbi:jg1973, partial [Pararge aegeria aegeria]